MLEARAFVKEIESVRKILIEKQAIFKGEYRCRDIVFYPTDPNKGLEDELLRLRINEKNIWNEKDVIVAIKKTEKRDIGKNSVILARTEFDHEVDARKYIDKNFSDDFKLDFEFTRTGWQYDLEDNQVDLERVENIPDCYTIEIKSKTDDELKKLVKMFSLPEPIKGPTVVAMKKLMT